MDLDRTHSKNLKDPGSTPPDSGIRIENKPEEDPEIHRQGQQQRR